MSTCLNCNKDFIAGRNTTGKYCCLTCSKEGQLNRARTQFLEGTMVNRGHIKKHIVDIHGWKCMCCNNIEWQGQPIPLELDHIDGNAGDNSPVNLRLLCPNCHAQTPTHKAKNKGKGRGSRGLPWY